VIVIVTVIMIVMIVLADFPQESALGRHVGARKAKRSPFCAK